MKQIGLSLILFASCIAMASCSRSSSREEVKKAAEEVEEIAREICACGPTCGCHTGNPHIGCGKDDSCGCHEHCSCME